MPNKSAKGKKLNMAVLILSAAASLAAWLLCLLLWRLAWGSLSLCLLVSLSLGILCLASGGAVLAAGRFSGSYRADLLSGRKDMRGSFYFLLCSAAALMFVTGALVWIYELSLLRSAGQDMLRLLSPLSGPSAALIILRFIFISLAGSLAGFSSVICCGDREIAVKAFLISFIKALAAAVIWELGLMALPPAAVLLPVFLLIGTVPVSEGSEVCPAPGRDKKLPVSAVGTERRLPSVSVKKSRRLILLLLFAFLSADLLLFLLHSLIEPGMYAPGSAEAPDRELIAQVEEKYEDENGLIPPEALDDTLNGVYKKLKKLPGVSSCEKGENCVIIEFDSGLEYVYMPDISTED